MFPVVWSTEGPLLEDGLLLCRVQSSVPSLLSRSKPHIDTSKLHVISKLRRRNESWCYKLVFLCLIDSTTFLKAYEPKVPFILRKVVLYGTVTRLPEVPWARANFPTFRVHLVIKLGKPLTWQTKVGSARRVYSPRLLFHPFSMTGSPT